jgi:PhnB protein
MPEGPTVHAAVAYLIVRDAARAIDFYTAAFGATTAARIEGPDGRVVHSELRIGEGTVYLADEHPELESIVGPESIGGTSVVIDLEADDVVALYDRALAAGATSVRRPTEPGPGGLTAKVRDPFGHVWLMTTPT